MLKFFGFVFELLLDFESKLFFVLENGDFYMKYKDNGEDSTQREKNAPNADIHNNYIYGCR